MLHKLKKGILELSLLLCFNSRASLCYFLHLLCEAHAISDANAGINLTLVVISLKSSHTQTHTFPSIPGRNVLCLIDKRKGFSAETI